MKIRASLAKMAEEDIELGEYEEALPRQAHRQSTLSSLSLRQPAQTAVTIARKNRARKDTCPARFCRQIKQHRKLVLLFIYLAYFCYAVLRCIWVDCPYDDDRWTLILLTCVIAGICIFYFLFIKLCWATVKRITLYSCACCLPWSQSTRQQFRWATYVFFFLCYLTFVLVDCLVIRNDPNALISLAGVTFLFLFCGLSSIRFRRKAPALCLQPIVVGMSLQFIVAFVVIRWPLGQRFFTWLAHVATRFFVHATEGGKHFLPTIFNGRDLAFYILPTIPFFAAFTSILSYLGWLHAGIKFFAGIFEKIFGTTAAESIACGANVFAGMAETPFLVRRFLPYMTRSELHAMMTGGFATIAVYMFGALGDKGIDPKYLLAACLMAGPASLALSKLVFPEIEHSSMRHRDIDLYAPSQNNSSPKNVLGAIHDGASMSISVVAHIFVNLISIISLKSLINGIMSWFGARTGSSSFGIPFIASYLFWPITFLIGIPVNDCRSVAQLLAIKLFSNDPFTPFSIMTNMTNNRNLYESYYCQHVFAGNSNSSSAEFEPVPLRYGLFNLPATNTTIGPLLSRRAETVATFALCGYSNLAAMAIQIGAIGALAPSTKSVITTIAIRALLTAMAVNLMNAAIAGVLLDYNQTPSWNETCLLFNNNNNNNNTTFVF